MKAVAFSQFGGSSELKIVELEAPRFGDNDVQIKISHTSVNPVDWKIRQGYLKDMFPHTFPVISGWDAAGTVEAVGRNVDGFKKGDRVYAYTRLPEVHFGTYAEFVTVPGNYVAHIPAGLTTAQAAATPLAALTAYQALHNIARIKKGETALILAGAGGVGSFAIQFASIAGAIVTSTASKRNHDYLMALGVAHPIDYTTPDWSISARHFAPKGFDVIIDGVGGESLKQVYPCLAARGRLVSIVDTPEKGTFHFVLPSGAELKTISEHYSSGRLKPPEVTVLPVTEAAKAQDLSQQGHVKGKIVLDIKF